MAISGGTNSDSDIETQTKRRERERQRERERERMTVSGYYHPETDSQSGIITRIIIMLV